MSLGVRREVVLSRWEVQVTKLRAESLQPPACPSKTTRAKQRPFWWHWLAGSWNVRWRVSYSARLRSSSAQVLCGWVETGSDRKIEGFRIHG